MSEELEAPLDCKQYQLWLEDREREKQQRAEELEKIAENQSLIEDMFQRL